MRQDRGKSVHTKVIIANVSVRFVLNTSPYIACKLVYH